MNAVTEMIVTGMQCLGRLPDLMRRAQSASLSEYVSEARVEPPVLLDERALRLPYIQDIMHTANSLYSAYYLQAWALSVNVGRINVRQILNDLNDRRNPTTAAGTLGTHLLNQESYRFGLPTVNFEAPGDRPDLALGGHGQGYGRETLRYSQEAGALSVGRVLEVQVEDQGARAAIPVIVRLGVSITHPETLAHILSVGTEDRSLKGRIRDFKLGRIEFFRDVILNTDLIDAHRKALMKDTSGYYKELIDKRRRNSLSAILSLSPTVGAASTIVVATTETLKPLEVTLGGPLKDYKVRQRLFQSTYTCLLFVIDTDWDQVNIYHRGIERPTELSVKDFKQVNKGAGVDITEVLKAYTMGRSVSL